MTLWTELARAGTPAGDEILLRSRGEIFEIRFNGLELMSNLNHQSEDVMALKSIRLFPQPPRRVLVGGLGMGFTLRAVLDALPAASEVVVSEIVPAIAEWNRGVLAPLAGDALCDPRVRLELGDVAELMQREPGGFDLILIDTDNGPDFLARAENGAIWQESGIGLVMRALAPEGLATFWSATRSTVFEEALDRAGTVWRCDAVPLIPGRADAMHHLYFTGSDARSLADRLAGRPASGPKPRLAA